MIVDTKDLVGTSDIARICGVRSSAVSNWIKRHPDFPKPVVVIGKKIKLWLYIDVLEWDLKRKRVKDERIERQEKKLQRMKERNW